MTNDLRVVPDSRGRTSLVVNGKVVNTYPVDHLDFKKKVPRLTGRILMAGLGMGYDLAYLLRDSKLIKIRVVELYPEVIERFMIDDPRAEYVCADWNQYLYDPTDWDWIVTTINENKVRRAECQPMNR